jgi:hypothetical protein
LLFLTRLQIENVTTIGSEIILKEYPLVVDYILSNLLSHARAFKYPGTPIGISFLNLENVYDENTYAMIPKLQVEVRYQSQVNAEEQATSELLNDCKHIMKLSGCSFFKSIE